MSAAIILDLLLAVLLGATIVYAVVLNRRLGAFRQGRDEIKALITEFARATEKARAGLDEINAASQTSAKALKSTVEEAKDLQVELNFLTERGTAVADRLAREIHGGRAVASDYAANDPDNLRKILRATR